VNGVHDMGGMHGMGPLLRERDEPVFHAPWERRVFAIYFGIDGDWPNGSGRYERELIPAAEQLRMSYYERWLASVTGLLVKSGMVTWREIATGQAEFGNVKNRQQLRAGDVASLIAQGVPTRRDVPVVPRYRVGDRVRARTINPAGHTRLPRYARGKPGTVVREHGVFAFEDSAVQGLGEQPQHVYTVRFTARDLWGEQASPVDSVYVDLWDDHLEQV
jgi:nitrile hydratase subunit beta